MTKIAIIGISALFPGASTPKKFWENLMSEKDVISHANQQDFGVDPASVFHPEKGVEDRCYSTRGGYIRDFQFDPTGFELPAEYLSKQDKLFQWSLYTAKEALIDGGYYQKKEQLEKCGLILGNLSFPTSSSHQLIADIYCRSLESNIQKLLKSPEFRLKDHQQSPPENEVLATPSEMVSKALALGKTHYALDAACATSLYAIKLACDELQTGKADMMLAGAVSASDQLFIHMGFSIFHAYSPMDKKFVPFDKESAGLVSSEGAGMVLLKRLEDAERDGDNIIGVIGGVGLSNDGRGKFLLSPNPKGQNLAFERTYAANDISPKDTSYIECHATGTPLGDKTELNSIANYFSKYEASPLLGSVKSNMGHLLTAAGMTGLLKVLLAMQQEVIPPNINLTNPIQSDSNWDGGNMITNHTPWKEKKKQAGINSFGFGGTNAHMVVENYLGHSDENKGLNKPTSLQPMAVVGMDAHFGNCENLESFYQAIYNGEQQFHSLPKNRWKGVDQDTALLQKYGFNEGIAPKGAYIEEFELDLLRYKIQPKEAEQLHPQQALLLKVADNSIKDAGLQEHENVAVLVAMETELAMHQCLSRWDVEWQVEEALEAANLELEEDEVADLIQLVKKGIYHREGKPAPSEFTSFIGNLMACRISALWDFSGPSFTVSCGDNSVFKALEIAQNMLSLGEVDAVVVGAVDFAGGLENVLLRQKGNRANTNADASCSFNMGDAGWLVGEGAGAVVLKKNTAQKHEKVYTVIDEIGTINPQKSFDYVELSATGIKDQDQYEQSALLKRNSDSPTALGTIKSNIGHTYAASGMASLIKTALCMHHRFIPAIPNWTAPQNAEFQKTAYYFPTQSRPWILPNGATQRSAAINGVGNIQLQLSGSVAETHHTLSSSLGQMPKLFILGGNDRAALAEELESLKSKLQDSQELSAIAQQLYDQFCEQQQHYSIILIAKNEVDLLKEIQFFQNQLTASFQKNQALKTPAGSYFTPTPLGHEGKVAFVYPGSATAYAGLGKDIFQLFPELLSKYENLLEDTDRFINSDYLYPKLKSADEVGPNIYGNSIAMMSAGVFYSAIFTDILRDSFKLTPNIAFGYSMGECSSMWYSLGIWDPNGAKKFRESPIFKNRFAGNLELLAAHWGITPQTAQEKWISMVVLAPKQQVEALIKGKEQVFLTFINTDEEVIISGDKKVCQQIVDELKCHAIPVPFQNVIHHDFCLQEKEGLLDMHHFEIADQPPIDFYSSITQNKIKLRSQEIAENSVAVCAQQVNFPRTIQTVYDAGARIFIEVGANATCTNWIQANLKNSPYHAVAINQKGKSDSASLVSLLAQLSSHGVKLDLSVLFPKAKGAIQKRQFMKKIITGGTPFQELFENEEMKQRFSKIRNAEKQRQPKRALVLAGEEDAVFSSSIVTIEQEANDDLPVTKKSNQVEKIRSTMDASTLINEDPAVIQEQKVGENGLRLQNYEAGEQFEGKEIVFSQEDLEEFATGKIGNVFGPEYSIIDTYSRRVMLPMHPYLLVSRVTKMDAKLGEYKPSTMTTEYDIPYNAWYTTDKQIPSAVCVESGQCDLLLISYLGIDLQNKGNLVYRLLDCTLTFMDDLPYEGQTLRYDISINSFVRNGDNLLFFFSYLCYVQDRLVLKMDGGCAGFFADDQLTDGAGVVYSNSEIEARKNAERKYFTPLLNTKKTSFSKQDLQYLIDGQIEKCFDDISYFPNGRNTSLRIPPEKILMLDRITSVDLTGGAYGLGYIVAEKDLHPDDWYFPCHFRDDEVLAGSLQAEGGGNLLRFFMLMLGLQRMTKDARFQPIFGLGQRVRCRKQVTPTADTKLIYKLEIKEIGLFPDPYVIGDLEIISDGVITVHFENLGLQLREKDNPKYLDPTEGVKIAPRSEGALMNEKDITTFALGNMTECFGPDFAIYNGRKMSRQPNSDLQLISRILSVEGTKGDFSKDVPIIAEYDVPEDAWYYQQNSNVTMPYSMLMEIALQPCGLLGAYMGSTLQFPDKDLYLRNLDGDGETFELPAGTDFRGKTITNKSVLTSSIAHGGTILQRYTFELSVDGHLFYKGNSSFGFFTAEALAAQAGLDKGAEVSAWYLTEQLQPADYMRIKLDSLYGKMKLFKAPENKPHYRLASDQLNMLHELIIAKNQGKFGKGYIHATKFVKTYDWFFTCHFYQDPVMPGSLGVESILQAMQVFALQQDLGKEFKSPKFVQVANHKTVWKYRGQILLSVKEMNLEVHVKAIEKRDSQLVIIADAFLWNDKMRIYQVTDIALGIEEA